MESEAYQLGVVIGMVLMAVLALGIPALFVVSLVFAIRRKTRAWLAAAICTGTLCLIPLGLFTFGLYKGISLARNMTATGREIPADRQIVSDDLLCSLRLPEHWSLLKDLNAEASLQAGNLIRNEYMVVLTDLKQDFGGTLEQHAEITSSSMVASLESPKRSGPEKLEINGYPAVRYEISGTTEMVNIVYIHTTIEGERGFHQLLGWTLSSRADSARDVLIETAASFREIEPA